MAKSLLVDIPLQGTGEFLCLVPEDSIDPRYLFYTTLSRRWLDHAEMTSYGTKMPRTSWEMMAAFELPAPSHSEQRRIADFLDDRIGRIDRIVDAAHGQIDRATEAMRSHLNEVLWHGRRRIELRRLAGSVTSGPRGWGDLVGSGEVPFLRIANLPALGPFVRTDNLAFVDPPPGAEAQRAQVREGDVLMSITASLGNVAVIGHDLDGSAFSQHVARIRPYEGVDSWWLGWALQSDTALADLRMSAHGGTRIGLGLAEVRGISVPLASARNQKDLAAELQRIWQMHSRGVEALTRRRRLFSEYKQSLITAAVSGDFDVTTASDRSVPAWA